MLQYTIGPPPPGKVGMIEPIEESSQATTTRRHTVNAENLPLEFDQDFAVGYNPINNIHGILSPVQRAREIAKRTG